MKKTIEYFSEDGCLGGNRGLSFNFKTNIITKWNGEEEPLSMDNVDVVKWCIDMNIKKLKERIINLQLKLTQKKNKTVRIEGGYKMSEVLTEERKIIFNNKLDNLLLKLEWFESLQTKPLITSL